MSGTPSRERDAAGAVEKQVVAVSHHQLEGGREALYYAAAPIEGEETIPEPETVSISRSEISECIDAIRDRIASLTMRALVAKPRDGHGIDDVADRLAQMLLPKRGLGGFVQAGANLHLDIVQDAAAEIPWELFRERFLVCPSCASRSDLIWAEPEARYCAGCGGSLVLHEDRLTLGRHLSHLVRGTGARRSAGRTFLLVEDPLDDLCSAACDPTGACTRHLQELHNQLEGLGFELEVLRGRNATRSRFRTAISGPDVAGIYFFGHGYVVQDGLQGQLALHDGVFSATDVASARPSAGFVFLNACHGAKAARSWELENRSRSVGAAFARGDKRKVVIAPLWPIVNVQAAEMAGEFFGRRESVISCAEALRRARRASLRRYEAGEAHLGWLAYRYFGDPSSLMPAPCAATAATPDRASALRPDPFVSDELDPDLFSFDIDNALIRSVKRQLQQRRSQVNPLDILAGLVRTGDWTRHVLRSLGVDPDDLYGQLLDNVSAAERGLVGTEDAKHDAADGALEGDTVNSLVRRFLVRRREQLSPDALRLLALAARNSRDLDGLITEDELLAAFLEQGSWAEALPQVLPDLAMLRRARHARLSAGTVDKNGALRLHFLEPGALAVVQSAHELAQQRGAFPISHRIFLAAFIESPDRVASRSIATKGIAHRELFDQLISSTEKGSPRSFGLGEDACKRIVLPVLDEARALAANASAVSEGELFKAFCRVAEPVFKASLRAHSQLDLDTWGRAEIVISPRWDPAVVSIVEEARQLARSQGWTEVRSPHLFGAMLGADRTLAPGLLRELGVDPRLSRDSVVAIVQPKGLPLDHSVDVQLGENTRAILERAAGLARAERRTQIVEADLLCAFLADGGGVVGEMFRRSGRPLPTALGLPTARKGSHATERPPPPGGNGHRDAHS